MRIDAISLQYKVAARMASLLSCCHLCCNTTQLLPPVRPRSNWRDLLLPITRALDDESVLLPAGHVYVFGVGNGDSLLRFRDIFLRNEVRLWERWSAKPKSLPAPPLKAPPTKWFGFDSFKGLPETSSEEKRAGWHGGSYRNPERGLRGLARQYFNEDNRQSSGIPYRVSLDLVAGFYNESLTPRTVRRYELKPAMFVEIDCDMHVSAFQALDFMFRHRLIVPGTLIGYDDWWVIPCAHVKRWAVDAAAQKSALAPSSTVVGEGLAHAQISRRYDVEFVCIAGPCRAAPVGQGHRAGWGPIFLVVSIGAGKGGTGFMSWDEEQVIRPSLCPTRPTRTRVSSTG